jgi:hypothetical protein
MRKRISRIAPIQLGKVAAIFYGLFSILFVAIMAVASMFGPSQGRMPFWLLIALPVIYIILGFIFMAVGALIYNLVARWVGGIEFTTEEISDA